MTRTKDLNQKLLCCRKGLLQHLDGRWVASLLIGFFVFAMPAKGVLIHFKANLSNANECGPACGVVATGTGAYTLDTATGMVTFYLVHNVPGETAAHTHGPLGPCPATGAPVLFGYPLGSPKFATYGPLTAAQMTDMQNGLHYANVHSSACGSGAARDQIRRQTVAVEACCLQNGTVCMTTDPQTCQALGGISQGPGTTCTAKQACCLTTGCVDLDPVCCLSRGGFPQGAGTSCTQPNICACGPNPSSPDRCKNVGCPIAGQSCLPTCVRYNPATGQSTVLSCECMNPNDCHVQVPGTLTLGGGNPCEVPNDGGTVDLPPVGCQYLSPADVHQIVNGLPPGTTIQLAAIHKDFICNKQGNSVCSFPPGLECEQPGGALGGQKECAQSTLQLNLQGTGTLSGYARNINLPLGFETHVAPRTPGQPVQSFDTEMFRGFGQLPPGDPDFDLLRVTAGNDFGLPSPGHTTLTQLPGGNWAVDSFFDITYRIDFVGHPGGPLGGMSGSTTGTIRMATGNGPNCVGTCPAGSVCQRTTTVNADGTIDICCHCVTQTCGPDPVNPSQCQQVTCPIPGQVCMPKCVKYNPATGQSQVLQCECRADTECHVQIPTGLTEGSGNPCEVPNAGGTVDLPPAGCQYLSPTEVHQIVNGLPPGTTIQLAAIHKDFICHPQGSVSICSFPLGVDCKDPGGVLGGEKECSDSTLQLNLTGTGTLNGYNRNLNLPLGFEVHTAPRTVGDPIQSFDTQMFRAFGQLPPGDRDFDLLRVTAGNDFDLPSPGHTTLTQLPGGNWAVDSFFDITYRIDFVGHSPGPLGGMSGSTTGTIRMATGNGPSCIGGCPAGYVCQETRVTNSDGTIDVCCNCVQPTCGPDPLTPSRCLPVTCPTPGQECQPHCVDYDPATGQTTVTNCACGSPTECHVQVPAGLTEGAGNPCEVPNVGGTVVLPPAGCAYLSPDQVHAILNGLPAGTTIELAPIHQNFICDGGGAQLPCSTLIPPGICEANGGGLGGQHDCFRSDLGFQLTGTGTLSGWSRNISLQLACEVFTAPRTPGQPVQSFDTEMFRAQGQLPPGDRDFDLLRVTAGSGFGLPSPGHTTLTQLPGGNWSVDSFFDITYRIDFVGHSPGPVAGMSGSTTATIRMATGNVPPCIGGCPPGYSCNRTVAVNPTTGHLQVCCNCVQNVVCQCPGDMNGDCKLNGIDIKGFVNCLITQPNPLGSACICADINGDNILNVTDLNLFVGLLLSVPKATCPTSCVPTP